FSYRRVTHLSFLSNWALDTIFVSKTLQLMLRLEDFCRAFTNDHARGHRVARCHAWHDGAVGDPKVVDPIDFQVAINHRHGVSAHLRCTGFVPEARGGIANEVFKFGTLQVSRHHLALDEW